MHVCTKMTIVDVSKHPKHYAGYKGTLGYGGIEWKLGNFEPFSFGLYQKYIFHIVLWF